MNTPVNSEAARAWSGAFLSSVGIVCLTVIAVVRRDVPLGVLLAPISMMAVRGVGLVWNLITTAVRPGGGQAAVDARALLDAIARLARDAQQPAGPPPTAAPAIEAAPPPTKPIGDTDGK